MLDVLTSEEFLLSLGTHSTAESLRRCLLKSEHVQKIRTELLRGAINEEGIQRFLAKIMPDFRHGVAFPHEMALAAIAVALEARNTPFVEEYLIDLAGTTVIELAMCRRVAGLSAKAWLRQPNFKKMSQPKHSYKIRNRIRQHFQVKAIAGKPSGQRRKDVFRYTAE